MSSEWSLTRAWFLTRSSTGARSHTWRRLVLAVVAACALALCVAYLTLGTYRISALDVVRGLGAQAWLGEVSTPTARFLLHEELFPRLLAAVAAGASFGMAGHITQLVFRHPLASPDVVGVAMGASASAAVSIVVFGASGLAVAGWASLGGGVVAAALAGVAACAQRWGGQALDALLVGVAFSWSLTAVVHVVMVQADVYRAKDAMVWLTGSLGSITWADAVVVTLVAGVGGVSLAGASSLLAAMRYGRTVAAGWGIRPGRSIAGLLVVAVLLAAGATAVTGPLAAVSLLAPVVARALWWGRPSAWMSALVGVCLVVGSDFVGRGVSGGLPAGVMTGVAGGVAVLWLASRRLEDV